MAASKKYRVHDIMEQIDNVEKMILFHANNPSKLMASQYIEMKERYFGELIEELMSLQDSTYVYKLIYLAIYKYYPELIETKIITEKEKDKIKKVSREFRELEAALVA